MKKVKKDVNFVADTTIPTENKEIKKVLKLPDLIDLKDNEMADALTDLGQNQYFWSAICRYNKIRRAIVDDTIRSVDPFKEPTAMARAQGTLAGLKDLEEYVILEIERRNKEANGTTEKPTVFIGAGQG